MLVSPAGYPALIGQHRALSDKTLHKVRMVIYPHPFVPEFVELTFFQEDVTTTWITPAAFFDNPGDGQLTCSGGDFVLTRTGAQTTVQLTGHNQDPEEDSSETTATIVLSTLDIQNQRLATWPSSRVGLVNLRQLKPVPDMFAAKIVLRAHPYEPKQVAITLYAEDGERAVTWVVPRRNLLRESWEGPFLSIQHQLGQLSELTFNGSSPIDPDPRPWKGMVKISWENLAKMVKELSTATKQAPVPNR